MTPLEQKILPPKRGKPRAYCPFSLPIIMYLTACSIPHNRMLVGKLKTHMETRLTAQPTTAWHATTRHLLGPGNEILPLSR